MMNFFKSFGKITYIQPILCSRIVCQKTLIRHCSVRRALFFVPGNNSDLLNNAKHLKVDSIVFDCESGVSPDKKDEARENIKNFFDSISVNSDDPEWCVRINPIQTPELCQADISAFLSAKNLPNTICLPMVKNVNQLEWFSAKVWNALIKREEFDRGPIKLILHIDSVTAMMRLTELCQKAEDLSTLAPILPVALVFNSNSILENIGGRHTESGIEVLYARQKLVLIAKAFGLQAIDQPYMKINDFQGFKESCLDGVILGFTGKQIIHIDQVVIAQEEFTPSRSKIHWAKTVLKTYRENQNREQDDFDFDNSLIDSPTLKQAENIINAATAAGKKIESDKGQNLIVRERDGDNQSLHCL